METSASFEARSAPSSYSTDGFPNRSILVPEFDLLHWLRRGRRQNRWTGHCHCLALAVQPVHTETAVFDGGDSGHSSSNGVLAIARKLHNGGGRLALCGLRGAVREVFEIAGLLAVLTIIDSPEAAFGGD